ncbi:hypothetical protein Taro_003578 [Colocasia esculenta]|uniref:Uncharacterized protein n=1 Tax=Colocasia esculenta TaxID=4460 RepID=A0A843TM32_COLES|nr:hypothetical protein [Colocasia esculenta]
MSVEVGAGGDAIRRREDAGSPRGADQSALGGIDLTAIIHHLLEGMEQLDLRLAEPTPAGFLALPHINTIMNTWSRQSMLSRAELPVGRIWVDMEEVVLIVQVKGLASGVAVVGRAAVPRWRWCCSGSVGGGAECGCDGPVVLLLAGGAVWLVLLCFGGFQMVSSLLEPDQFQPINAMYQDLMDRLKVSSIEQLARQQVDGVVRRSEFGLDNYVQSAVPSTCKHIIHAHDGGCGSIAFQNNSNKLAIAACSSNNLYALELASGRSRHTLSGHRDKVCAVDAPKIPSRYLASAAYDHTIKFWDLNSGFCVNTIMSNSNCNALCYSIDGLTICSGHLDGNLRLWDSRTGKFINEVVGHSNAITSICLARSGNTVLTSGRDNIHNLYDLRSLEVCETFKVSGNQLASNWSRSCISADDNYVAIGSADGSVHVWSRLKKDLVATLKGHTAPVLSCSWSGLGQPLASADKSGTICIWA